MKNKILLCALLLFSSFSHSISFVRLVPSVLLGNLAAYKLYLKSNKLNKARQYFQNIALKKYELFLKMSDEDKDKYFKKLISCPKGKLSEEDLRNFFVSEYIKNTEIMKLQLTRIIACYSSWALSSFLIYKGLDKLGVK